MKIIRYAVIFMLLSAPFLQANSHGYQEWLKRREALIQDASVINYYTFEDVRNSKSIVKDLSGSGAHLSFVPYRERGEVFDDLQVVEGRWPEKNAVRLDMGWYEGTTVPLENRQFTAEVWFRRQGPGSIVSGSGLKNGAILSSGHGRWNGWRLATGYERIFTLHFIIGQTRGLPRPAIQIQTGLPDNVWHNLAAVWDGSHMKLYLNGELVGMDEFTGSYMQGEDNRIRIGYSAAGMGSIKLDIDEVVIYDRALSDEEIAELGKGSADVSEENVFSRADKFIEAGDYESARREYFRLKNLPNYGQELALFNIAESYRLEGDYASVHNTYERIYEISGLTTFYRIYGLFRQAEVYIEQKDYDSARRIYQEIILTDGALQHHVFKARLKKADSHRIENNHSRARTLYKNLLTEEERSPFPNDGYRLELRDRLEEIEGLADGESPKSRREELLAWVNAPQRSIYVSPGGSDENSGTKELPFATIERAQAEVREIKSGSGMPQGGISVYLREGRYFLSDSIVFGKEDSGTEKAPVVYRSYPGEEVRLVGGREIGNFMPLTDPDILRRLPETSREKVWVADLKEQGISEYGELLPRGMFRRPSRPGAMELIYNGKIMRLARWPNEGWQKVAGITSVDWVHRNTEHQLNRFVYSGNRPERWKEEKEMWIKSYARVQPYIVRHSQIGSIDLENNEINLVIHPIDQQPHTQRSRGRVPMGKDAPYFVYNLLSEIEVPGEWYLDRDTGKLYFYPPGDIKGSEIIVTTLDKPLLSFKNASNIALKGLVVEGGWQNGIEVSGGRNNLIAAGTIRNTGQWAVVIESGWEHKVVGCDIYDTGEGGVSLDCMEGGTSPIIYREKLIPARHLVENNHIYRFNRFCGGSRHGIRIHGIGQRVAHNVIHDSPHQMIDFNANDHIIEFNELHDGPHEGREIGAMYVGGGSWYLMSRGTVIRNNFFHHITPRSSPNLSHGIRAIHIDVANAGLVMYDNIFFMVSGAISSNYPGNWMTNNLFINSDYGIVQADRTFLFWKDRDIAAGPHLGVMELMGIQLKAVRAKQPPWNYRYPPLVPLLETDPAILGQIQGSVIERNVNTGGPFISFARGIRETTLFENNWDGQNPLFLAEEDMDFSLRLGSPVYGLTGCDPVDMGAIGVYKDNLRASWPINRTEEDIGRYYLEDWLSAEETMAVSLARVSPPLEYEIPLLKGHVKIDGILEQEEWPGMADKKNAMIIERDSRGEGKKGPRTYVWLQYDSEYLYIATKHQPDPWTEDMHERRKTHLPAFEIAIESQHGPHSHSWWMDDMDTGPIYAIWGYFDGRHEVKNIFGMPHESLMALEQSIEYRKTVKDKDDLTWTSEMKIPLENIGVNPGDIDTLAFNIGVSKRGGWFAWVPTGSAIWRVANAGIITFAEE